MDSTAAQPAADRPEPVRGLRRRILPGVVVAMAAVLMGGAMAATAHHRGSEARQGHLTPAPPSSSRSPLPRLYIPEAAGVPEAADVAGVSVGPVSEQDAAGYRDLGFYYLNPYITEYSVPEPGQPLSFTVKYMAGQKGPEVAVLSWEFQGAATGRCPGPFLVRPVHTYLLHCQAVLRPGPGGGVTLSYYGESERSATLLPLVCPQCLDTFDPSARKRVATRFARLTSSVPEASDVAGVAVGPASTERPGYTGLAGPFREFAGSTVVPGRSYPFTVDYLVASDGDPVALLSMGLGDVASGSCPKRFLARAGHTYRISCRVMFRQPAAARLKLSSLTPAGTQTQIAPLLEPGS